MIPPSIYVASYVLFSVGMYVGITGSSLLLLLLLLFLGGSLHPGFIVDESGVAS